MSEGDVKPKIEGEQMTLKVKEADGNETMFKIKKTTKLGKVIDAFVQRKGLQKNAVKFLFDGNRIQDTDTPESLGLEDNDAIDVMLEQTGGA